MPPDLLEFDDIQHILLDARSRAHGTIRIRVVSAARPTDGAGCPRSSTRSTRPRRRRGSLAEDARWVTVAFTWNGLRALGVDDRSLATFPDAFKQGMAARATILGDTGANHPDHWVGGVASPDLHAIVILFARDAAERERCRSEHQTLLAACPGVEVLSSLDLRGDPAIRPCARSLRLSRSDFAAGHRRDRARSQRRDPARR